MNLTPDRIAELEVNLKENGLIDSDERIVEACNSRTFPSFSI